MSKKGLENIVEQWRSDLEEDPAAHWILAAVAPRTLAQYRWAFEQYDAWAEKRGLESLPLCCRTLEKYVLERLETGVRETTIRTITAGVVFWNQVFGHPPVNVHRITLILKGAKRLQAPKVKKQAISMATLKQICASLEDTLIGKRDHALFTLAWFSALRRAEVMSLNLEHVEVKKERLLLRVPRVKGQPEGRVVEVPASKHTLLCPVKATTRWLEIMKTHRFPDSTPLFVAVDKHGGIRSDRRLDGRTLARRIKVRVEPLGLDPTIFSATSLRRGFVTEAAHNNVPTYQIAKTTGHRSPLAVWDYIAFEDLEGPTLQDETTDLETWIQEGA